jgi:hypothetical protein
VQVTDIGSGTVSRAKAKEPASFSQEKKVFILQYFFRII